MKNKQAVVILSLMVVAVLAFLLAGCQVVPVTVYITATPRMVTVTPDDIPTSTTSPTLTQTATSGPPTIVATDEPTVEVTADEPPTPTRIVNTGNLLLNPSFEGLFRDVWVDNEEGGEYHTVANYWFPFYCGRHYTPEDCNAPKIGEGNPIGLLMGRPEYKPTVLTSRVNTGRQAQQWFCFYRTCQAGVYQTVLTEPGVEYEVGAYFQSWANCDGDPESDFYSCDTGPIDYNDAILNTEFFIYVSLLGDTFAFASENYNCGTWEVSQENNFYDRYTLLSCRFIAQGESTVVFLGSVRNWPIPNNDSYVDDAYVIMVEK